LKFCNELPQGIEALLSVTPVQQGSLFRVSDAYRINRRAKEYLHRLSREGYLKRIYRGWYFIPAESRYRDPWDFLVEDKGFKVIVKQSAASIWNHDFVHRDVYRLASTRTT